MSGPGLEPSQSESAGYRGHQPDDPRLSRPAVSMVKQSTQNSCVNNRKRVCVHLLYKIIAGDLPNLVHM